MRAAEASGFERNERLEELLEEINALLAPAEEELAGGLKTPRFPVLLIVGAPRSGTTLLLQWLAQTRLFGYPSNLISRFFRAPAVGAKIQLLLTDPRYRFRDELFDLGQGADYTSSLGKTRGALSANEFWYFWRRFAPYQTAQHLSADEERQIDGKGLAAALAALEAAFDKPLALKGLMLQYNLPLLASILPSAVFLFIQRHPLYNMQSLLEARLKYQGSMNEWWSVKPREYPQLKDLDPYAQVAGQVHFTHRTLSESLAELDGSRGLVIPYEDFCRDPRGTFSRILDKLTERGLRLERDYHGPRYFEPADEIRLAEAQVERLIAAYREISGETLGFDSGG